MKNKHNGKRSVKQTLLRRTEFSMIVIIAILFLIAAVGTKNFLTAYNLTNILKQSSIIGIIAIAETCIIITGGIDISCGAVVGMSTLVVTMAQGRWGLSIPAAICLALISGLLCGALNAVLVHEFNVTPFVATLGTQTIIRGLIKVYSNGGTVSGLKPEFSSFASSSFGILPNLSIVWIAIAIIMFLVLRYTVYGRNLFILGSGKEVTRLNGISIRKVNYQVYIMAGLLYAISGILLAARINCAVPTAGEAYETNAIAASVLGGASLSGGLGSVLGTMLGTLLIILIDNVGTQFGINTFIMQVVTGCVIVIAIIVDQLKKRRGR